MTKRKWTESMGSTLAISLLLLLGVSVCAFTLVSGNAYNRLSEQTDNAFRLRTAVNYITNHIRRADTAQGIAVQSTSFGDCLVLSEDISGEIYETRIYLHDGHLQESFVPALSPYDEQTGFDVTALEGFSVSLENGMVLVTLTSGNDTRTVTVAPMSKGGAYEA